MSILTGIASIILLILNTLFWGVPLIILTLVKLAVPFRPLQRRVLNGLNAIALNWIGFNLWWMRKLLRPDLHATLPENLSEDDWWLVISNHRSWTDIFMLLMVLHRRIPMPRFFLKHQLIWIPVVGLAWWALEFPFMRRYSREKLARNPKLAERDRLATERMCRRAREAPITIFNFVEGTRYSKEKRDQQQSPYRHLLRPKAGGTAQVLGLLGSRLGGIIDVTLDYTNPNPSFWEFLCGKEGRITLYAQQLEVPEWMLNGDYHQDPEYKERFHTWLNELWLAKDAALDAKWHR